MCAVTALTPLFFLVLDLCFKTTENGGAIDAASVTVVGLIVVSYPSGVFLYKSGHGSAGQTATFFAMMAFLVGAFANKYIESSRAQSAQFVIAITFMLTIWIATFVCQLLRDSGWFPFSIHRGVPIYGIGTMAMSGALAFYPYVGWPMMFIGFAGAVFVFLAWRWFEWRDSKNIRVKKGG